MQSTVDADSKQGRARDGRPRVLIIGAGVSGAAAAHKLNNEGCEVTVVDKGRSPGGRVSTREGMTYAFDHGAQYFTARDESFRRVASAWCNDGVAEPWPGRFVEVNQGESRVEPGTDRLVGVPAMNRVVSHLLKGIHVEFETQVTSLNRASGQWRFSAGRASQTGPFDAVVVTMPAPQAAVLLQESCPALSDSASQVQFQACWAVLATFPEEVALPWDGVKFRDSRPLGWVARNSSKPGRPVAPPEHWVLHASNRWSSEHLEDDREQVAGRLLDEFSELCFSYGQRLAQPTTLKAHRWRYARPAAPLGQKSLLDESRTLALCGDWLIGARVEAAYVSGVDAANLIRQGLS